MGRTEDHLQGQWGDLVVGEEDLKTMVHQGVEGGTLVEEVALTIVRPEGEGVLIAVVRVAVVYLATIQMMMAWCN